jgi:hypothetical protein
MFTIGCHRFYPEPDQTSPGASILFLITCFTLSSHLGLYITSDLFPSVFPTLKTTRISVLPVKATCPANLTTPNLVTRMIFQYMTTNREAFHCAVFSILLSVSPTCAQIPSTASCPRIPSGWRRFRSSAAKWMRTALFWLFNP